VIKALHTTLPLPSKINQIDGLQILRAVAVLMVAWLHAGQWLFPMSARSLPTFGAYGIDMFFVISGFIVSSVVLRSRQEPGATAMWEFLKRRLIRIFPIYWFFCLLQIVRLLHSHQLFQQNYLPAFFLLPGLRHIETPLLVDFSWTMIFEMFFYYALAVTLLGTIRRAVPAAIAIFCGAIVLGCIVGIRRPIWIVVCNPIVLEFVFGALLAMAYRHFGRRQGLGMVLLFLGTAASICLAMFPSAASANGQPMILNGDGVMLRVMTWGVAAMMVVGGMVFWSPAIRSRLGRIAVVLGNSSYSAYLASGMVIEFTMRLIFKLVGGGVPFSVGRVAVYQIAVTVSVFAAGWVCYQFVEWPMLRWLQARLLAKAT
jgi:exopolysaccharide production protein ExoZ